MLTTLGIPISELGLLFGLFPLAAGELLLFGGSVIGIPEESGYVALTIRAITALAVIFLTFSAGLAFTNTALVIWGYAVIVATILLAVDGVVFGLFVRE